MRRLAAALVLAALTLAGCSGGDDHADISTEAQAAPTEAVASEQATATYPDGLRVTLVGLEEMDPALGSETAMVQTLVRVALRYENVGPEPIDIGALAPVTLYSGADRYETGADPGFAYVDEAEGAGKPVVQSEDPQRVAPGSKVEVFRSFNVPTPELDELTVEVHVGEHPAFMFTDAEALLS